MMLHIEEEKKMLFFSSLLPSNEAFTFEWLLLFLDVAMRRQRAAGGSISTAFKKEIRDYFRSFFYGNSRLFPTLFYAVRP